MIVCYTIMGRVLWGSQSIGEHTQRQIESIKSKKKVGMLCVCVCVCVLFHFKYFVRESMTWQSLCQTDEK